MVYPQFLGFVGKVEIIDKNVSRDERFKIIEKQTRDLLKDFPKNGAEKKSIFNKVIVLNLKLLCRDKFADYQSDESNIIVRTKSAETIARCFLSLAVNQQVEMLKMCKKIFEK